MAEIAFCSLSFSKRSPRPLTRGRNRVLFVEPAQRRPRPPHVAPPPHVAEIAFCSFGALRRERTKRDFCHRWGRAPDVVERGTPILRGRVPAAGEVRVGSCRWGRAPGAGEMQVGEIRRLRPRRCRSPPVGCPAQHNAARRCDMHALATCMRREASRRRAGQWQSSSWATTTRRGTWTPRR